MDKSTRVSRSSCDGERTSARLASRELPSGSRRLGTRGQVTVETIAGLMVLIPIFLALYDCIVVLLAFTFNEDACRNAARAASTVTATSSALAQTAAQDRANSIIKNREKRYAQTKMPNGDPFIEGPKLKTCTISNFKAPDEFGGPIGGTVSVQTEVKVNLPVAIAGVTPTNVTFLASSAFPLTGQVNRDPNQVPID